MGEIGRIGAERDDASTRLIARVGERVRRAREQKGLPRRVLSDVSGVSPRYLAQLEAGEGNISIGLLHRVAVALDQPLEWLVSEEDAWDSEALQVAELYRQADPQARARAMEILTPRALRARRICLIGLRGAGKSTLGARAGRELGLPFVELNREIEETTGMPIAEVMALYGQDGYRDLEAEALERVTQAHDAMILAVAGGLVAEPETYARLLAQFHTVWLRAEPEEHMARVRAQGDERPMAGNPQAMAQLRALLASREPLYARAEAQLDTSGKTEAAALDELLDLIRRRGFLD